MTKKLHITLDLPDDVAARLRESFTGERLKYESHRSIEDISLPREPRVQLPRISAVLVLLALFAAGVVMGYTATGEIGTVFALVDRWATAWAPGADGAASPQRQAPVTAAPRPATVVPSAQSVPPSPPRARSLGSPSPVIYRVQVGAFRQKQNADALVSKLQSHGFNASSTLKAGLHRVQVGAFSVRKDADALAKELRAQRYDVIIVQEATSRQR